MNKIIVLLLFFLNGSIVAQVQIFKIDALLQHKLDQLNVDKIGFTRK